MFIIKYLIILKTPKTRHQRELQWIVTKYYANIILSGATLDISFIYYFFWLFRAIPTAYGSFQARGQTGAAATSLCHSNAGSEPHLRFTPQHTGSLTHWVGSEIKPASSWILVGFTTVEPQWELLDISFKTGFLFFHLFSAVSWSNQLISFINISVCQK